MPSILIICTANQCRSPLAEALLRRQLNTNHPTEDWRIDSAGTWATNGRSAHADMRTAAAEVGLDLTAHRARNVDSVNLEAYDLLLTMEQNHKEAIQVEFPDIRDRIYLLSEMFGVVYDIPDPIGGPLDDYRITIRELDRLLKLSLSRIVDLANAAHARRVS